MIFLNNLRKNINEILPFIYFFIIINIVLLLANLYKRFRLINQFDFDIVYISKNLTISMIVVFILLLVVTLNKKQLLSLGLKTSIEQRAYFDKLMLKNWINLLSYFFITVISCYSLYVFVKSGPTSFEWPGIDMGPFFERYANSNFSPNDFFTNASSKVNPRFVFGYTIILLQKIFYTNWYQIYYFIKLLLVLFLPSLYFNVILSAAKKYCKNDAQLFLANIIAFVLVMMVFSSRINGFFSIAWWTPLNLVVSPQTLSLFFGLLYILYINIQNKYARSLSLLLLVLSLMMQPAIGLFILIFSILLNIDNIVKYKINRFFISNIIFSVGVVVLVYMFFLLFFNSNVSLGSRDFVLHYVIENHSAHYLPSEFGSFTSFPWYYSFLTICFLFALILLGSYRKKDKELVFLSFVFMTVYSSSVLFQYLFVEVFPVKIITVIGPVRFTIFGYWLLSVLVVIYLFRVINPVFIVPSFDLSNYFNKRFIYIYFIFAGLFIFGFSQMDDPVNNIKEKNYNLYNWISKNTSNYDVLVVPPSFPPYLIPLIFKRSVFFGNGFPFREDDFIENDLRKKEVFGSHLDLSMYSNLPLWARATEFYRLNSPNKFNNISKKFRLDYVFIEKGYSSLFSCYSPVFQDDNINIYKIKDLNYSCLK